MPKRSRSATTPLTPNRKRTKTSQPQPSIHQFFSPTTKPSPLVDSDYLPGIPGPSRKKPIPEIIDVDLTEDEGETLKHSPSVSAPTAPATSTPSMMKFAANSVKPTVYDDLTLDPVVYDTIIRPWPSATLPYSFLAHTLATLAQTRSRILIQNTLTNSLRTIILHDSASLLPALYLLSNTLAPPYSPVELGLGPSIISRAIQHVSGLSAHALKKLYVETGDVGDVAFSAKSNVRTLLPHPPLLVTSVYSSLLKIALCKGNGAAKEKQKIVERLLLAASGEEIRFLTRTLSQNLRVGAVRTSILTALSRAMVLTPLCHLTSEDSYSSYHVSQLGGNVQSPTKGKGKRSESERDDVTVKFTQAEVLLRRVYVQHPNYEHIVSALLRGGLDNLQHMVSLTVGIPLHPTLGSPTRSLEEIYEVAGDRPFVAEFKYDGQRAQIHGFIENGEVSVRIFSRHLEDMTAKYPDVVLMVKSIFDRHSEVTSFILDSEIVAIDHDGNLKTFQELSNRARKDVDLQDVRVSVCVFAFDVMYLDGESLLEHTFRERRNTLHSRFQRFIPSDERAARFDHVDSCWSEKGRDAVEQFWERAIGSRCEGLMIKLLDNEPTTEGDKNKTSKTRRKQLPATYEPDKRTSAWLKLKKDYVTGLGDTLDLIPIGAWHGNGRKAQWWSPILLGVWQPESGRVVALCKCMSGFTDAFYKSLTERYQLSENADTCSVQPLWECDIGGLKPEVYFKPQEVWEIRGADITLSPVSVAAKGLVSDTRGLSLRFPRFLKVRADKNIEQASTPRFLASLWKKQEAKGGVQGMNDDGELIDINMGDSDSNSFDSD
ncbi:DNA ligase 3 [Hypsizygus marmoreus]|uniref:DNA ligase n=1 Tax=Hypsizygus marmoreus TaxID=39966 RepID=A0A369JWL3_HYPMA|nr:DNA ligase 3 [Hypsizygus marmoreus]